ncbi:hypothetical protein L9F63_002722 [Diploptera punctata]|uniref:Uncharacterized protein n=1 Tax=Diploptera punctata TaxID=6984 RepID=A0AAD7ZRP9_DIPPU|nr:hypothetical protein L9F63_002722 [Diploptera punctata]
MSERERKISRNIYGAVQEQDIWRIITNQELKDLYRNFDLVRDIRRERLEVVEHVLRMEKERGVRTILEGKPEGRRNVGREILQWLDEEDLRQLKVKRWRQKASNREEWTVVMKEAEVLIGS